MRLTVTVRVRNCDPADYPAKVVDRVIETLMPHPDSVLYTGAGAEHLVALVTEWKVTSG